MVRTVLGVVAVCFVCTTIAWAADDKAKDAKAEKPVKATITKMDAKKGSMTVTMKDKEGKDVERTFKLAESVRYFDGAGKVIAIDVFESGNEVLVLEEEGQLKEVHKDPKAKKPEPKTPDKK